MESLSIYLWGAVGGFFAAGFVHVIPGVARMAHTDHAAAFPRPRVVAAALLVAFLTAAAGLIPLIPDDVTRGQAISLGLASQAILKGLISGVMEAIPRAPG